MKLSELIYSLQMVASELNNHKGSEQWKVIDPYVQVELSDYSHEITINDFINNITINSNKQIVLSN